MKREILGKSPAVKEMVELIMRVSTSRTSVLIIGESGTGKELVARMIHEEGPASNKPFVPVNCGAIPENLIESEMFGHRRGSFTGAVGDKMGLFEAANGGTLFLDEVGELPLGMQVKLLRAIQERSFRKVGGGDDIKVDLRIIAATNRDLEAAVQKGTFREDLYYRLNVIQIRTPPLRERPGDVKVLAEWFLGKFAKKLGKGVTKFDPEALRALESHPWPGNIRELENVVERAVTLGSGEEIGLHTLPEAVAEGARVAQAKEAARIDSPPAAAAGGGDSMTLPAPDFSRGPMDLEKILGEVERFYLQRALAYAGGVRRKAADALGVTFRSMRYRLKKLGVDAGDDDGEE